MSELERFWSPEPVIAYKFYVRHNITKQLVGRGTGDLEVGKLLDATCSIRQRQEKLKVDTPVYWMCAICAGPMRIRCEGEGIPFNEHHWRCECADQVYPSCGFYAYRLDNASDHIVQSVVDHTTRFITYKGFAPQTVALVRVALHGTVLEHGYGYKASQLKIAEIGDERSDCSIPIVRNVRSGWLIDSWMKIIKEWRERYYA